MSQLTFTDTDFEQLLVFTPEPDEIILHYYRVTRPHDPALCGEAAPAEGWDKKYQPSRDGVKLNRKLTICPACQVAQSHITGGAA